jgi:hypothetical protein
VERYGDLLFARHPGRARTRVASRPGQPRRHPRPARPARIRGRVLELLRERLRREGWSAAYPSAARATDLAVRRAAAKPPRRSLPRRPDCARSRRAVLEPV